jgi:hypothetical protein
LLAPVRREGKQLQKSNHALDLMTFINAQDLSTPAVSYQDLSAAIASIVLDALRICGINTLL